MGSIGAGKSTVSNKRSFVDSSVQELADLVQRRESESSYTETYDRIRKEFNIPGANEKQIDMLRTILKGIAEHDKGYDENKTPFVITYFNINQTSVWTEEERKAFGLRKRTEPIQISISTQPNTDNALVRMWDAKDHYTFIGPQGSLFTYTEGGKKKSLKLFDVTYGTSNYYRNRTSR